MDTGDPARASSSGVRPADLHAAGGVGVLSRYLLERLDIVARPAVVAKSVRVAVLVKLELQAKGVAAADRPSQCADSRDGQARVANDESAVRRTGTQWERT